MKLRHLGYLAGACALGYLSYYASKNPEALKDILASFVVYGGCTVLYETLSYAWKKLSR
ncbi:MAG: hypothetical protein QXQ69_01080 [Candidatus Aenigmatarchaeota archaeon]